MDSIQAKELTDSLQGTTIDGWTVSGFYGNGKSAVVVPAEKGGVKAALKIFHRELIERYGRAVQLERISREKSLIGLTHPNLVQILDGGECPITGHLYVAMEPLACKNLRDALLGIPPEAIPKLIAQIASAARFLEDMNLIHRDIKPENIAVTDDFSRAILLDLGVLQPVGVSNLTDVDARPFIGTLRYSSPEFLRRHELPTIEGGRAITFYQLGAVLHDMLMKRPIFSTHTEPFMELAEAIFNETPEIFGEDTRCVALAKKCLIKNPAKRLELVSWSDFADQSPATSASLTVMQARLRARQAVFKADQEFSNVLATEANRVAKQRLGEVSNQFLSRIASLLNASSSLFPLRTTRSEKNIADQTSITTIQFEKDASIGLPHHLTIQFVIRLIDENNGTPMYKAFSAAALSNDELSEGDLVADHEFFAGEIDGLLDSAELEQQFAGALEAAYIALDKGLAASIAGILKLTITEAQQNG